jgi:thiol:disulfide interchange protein
MKNWALFFIFLSCSAGLHGATSPWHTNPQGKVRLITAGSTASAENPFQLGVQFQPAPGWVVYWKNAGDAGFAPKFDFQGSKGFANPEILWPRPRLFVLPGDIKEYGYEREVVYPVRASRTGDSAINVRLDLRYLTCKESCVPYHYTLALDLPAGPSKPDTEAAALIQKFESQVPKESDAQLIASLKPERLQPPAASGTSQTLWVIVLLAFLGGVLLNVMPCVLPVLSIKLFGLLQHGGQDRRVVIRDALASAAGIVFSFMVGGFLIIAAKETGKAVGWGIQFQNPIFVLFLIVLVLLFALNLWGIFEIPLPNALSRVGSIGQDDEGPLSYFVSGMFATLLATPCSAPFLGTAMGFALTQSAGTILLIFLSSALGLSFPYFVLAVVPSALLWLPRPGAWMAKLKAVLGLLLAGTGIWLGWIFVQQVGWIKPAIETSGPIHWVPFKEVDIQRTVDSGKPVFVDVTAAWCLTCKVNERLVIDNPEVVAEFNRRGIVMMRADWTNQDAAIGEYLKKFGRAGIPFYALYYPKQDPIVFSELLTSSKLLSQLRLGDTRP